MAQALAGRAAARRHASVSYALYDGGHDWQLWHAHLNQMLVPASHDVSEPPRRGSGKGTTLTPGVLPIPNGAGHRRHSGNRARVGGLNEAVR